MSPPTSSLLRVEYSEILQTDDGAGSAHSTMPSGVMLIGRRSKSGLGRRIRRLMRSC